LERIKEDFKRRYLAGNGTVTPAVGKEFGVKLKEHMQYCVEHPEEMNKISKIKSQVAEVKGIMMDNIEKVSAIFPVVLTLQWHMNYKPC
jgi:vesicle-associated membrane protein 72